MRIGIAGISHESNTFASQPTTLERFEEKGIVRGKNIVTRYEKSHSTISGYIQGAKENDFEIVPLFVASAVPLGPLTADTYETLLGEVLESIRKTGQLDGLFIFLHGAMVSEKYLDADGEMCARVRRLLGPDIPVMITPDLHGNISPKMIENTTATVIYRMNPHLDTRERGLETARLMARTVRGEINPVQHLEMPPMIINILKQHTLEEPCLSLIKNAEEAMKRPNILSASCSLSYQYADVPEMGASFVAVADGDMQAARDAARWMAQYAWDQREKFMASPPSPEEALKEAAAFPERPVVLMDVGDNVGGGSAADSTVLLEAALNLSIGDIMIVLYDPESVQACVKAGIGTEVALEVGGKTDTIHGRPIPIKGRVRTLTDGRFIEYNPVHGGGRYYKQGLTAVVETKKEHTIVLTSLRVAPVSIEQILSCGIKPERKKILIAKGVVAPRGAYQPIAAKIILVDSPGATDANISRWEYTHRRRPMFPFEPETVYNQ